MPHDGTLGGDTWRRRGMVMMMKVRGAEVMPKIVPCLGPRVDKTASGRQGPSPPLYLQRGTEPPYTRYLSVRGTTGQPILGRDHEKRWSCSNSWRPPRSKHM